MLDARAERVRAELAEAARLRDEAEAMLKQAEADRAAALREAEEMLARARAEAERVGEAAAAEAEAAAKRRERMAMDRIAAAEAGAVAEVRSAAAEVATAAARDVIAERLDAEADAALIDRAVADLPRALRAAERPQPTAATQHFGARRPRALVGSAADRVEPPTGASAPCVGDAVSASSGSVSATRPSLRGRSRLALRRMTNPSSGVC